VLLDVAQVAHHRAGTYREHKIGCVGFDRGAISNLRMAVAQQRPAVEEAQAALGLPPDLPPPTWRRDVVRATVLAYRKAMGEGLTDWQAGPGTLAAYLAAGGDPERAERDIPDGEAASTQSARAHSGAASSGLNRPHVLCSMSCAAIGRTDPKYAIHLVENLRARLKEWHAVATRYEKTARSFPGVLCLAATADWVKRR
jgi:hypothetical protein